MGLLGEVQEEQARHRVGGTCGIKRVLDSLDPADRDDLIAALALDPAEAMHSTIARVLKARGHEVSDHTVRRHRNGECRCAR